METNSYSVIPDCVFALRLNSYRGHVLHLPTSDGGVGFCGAALPELMPVAHHGPLVVVLDANILIDLRVHGARLIDDGEVSCEVVPDREYRCELAAIAALLDLWLLRDIRFVVTPRALSDKKNAKRFENSALHMIDALANALYFQFGSWTEPGPMFAPSPPSLGTESGLPDGADRDLLIEAQGLGAHVFLTRDRKLVRRASMSGPTLTIVTPNELMLILGGAAVTPFTGGVCHGQACPYSGDPTMGDNGKWGALLSAFEELDPVDD